jgi:uncharacterized repeat protein (TIGR03943 family)
VVAAVTAAGGTISMLLGAVLLRLALTGTYRRYVQPGMGPWLVAAGFCILVVGAITLFRALRGDDHDAHEHGRQREGVGWLLLAPIAALLLVAPPTLGSFGVDRGAVVDVRRGAPVFAPLPHRDAPIPMALLEFGQRAFDHGGESFDGQTVALTGFVAGVQDGGFRLARYQIACCAADAAPVVIRIVGISGDPPARDQWVTVTGSFQPSGDETPTLAATAVLEIPAPEDPYE